MWVLLPIGLEISEIEEHMDWSSIVMSDVVIEVLSNIFEIPGSVRKSVDTNGLLVDICRKKIEKFLGF